MITNFNLNPRDFILRDLTEKEFEMPEQRHAYPKWVEGQLCKDEGEESAVKAGGKSDALPTMTKPKAPKRRNGRRD